MTANHPVPRSGLAPRQVKAMRITAFVSPPDANCLAASSGRRVPQVVNQAGDAATMGRAKSAVSLKHPVCTQITLEATAPSYRMRATVARRPIPLPPPTAEWRSGLSFLVVQGY